MSCRLENLLSSKPSTMCLCALILVSLAAFTARGYPSSPPVVNTVHGKILGKYVSLEGFTQPVAIFLGVPFAKPPLGSLRFAPPQPAEPWSFVKNATSYPPMCSQDPEAGQIINDLLTNRKESIPLQFSEDCLYLNIYTPADLTRSSRLPVMVWIHGGGLVLGGASTYDGLALSIYENVVVVVIQYRLGIWGFFSTGDEHSPGNWGHLDQVAALRWVQDNIANFGGDPGSVTIFGESAGGESVSVLKIAVTAGCKNTTSAAMVHCLRQKTEEELLETTLKLNLFKLDLHEDSKVSYPFVPTVVDGVFLSRTPEEILTEKSFNTVPYMVGINKQEFGWILPTMMNYPPSDVKLDQKTATSLLQKSSFILNLPEDTIPVIIKKYLRDTDDPDRNKEQLLELIGDVVFGVPSVIMSREHRDAGAPTYVYEFQYRPSFSSELKPKTVIGDHGDEVYSVFGAPILRAGHPSSPPVVNTAHGKVLGKYVNLKGFTQPVAIFLGVPFAKPPLGSLRFAPPQPAESWNFVKNATSYPPMCSQDPVGGQVLSELFTNRKENIPLQFSEDCLYLNIYTPADLTKNSRLPVMVWIHGGGLVVGGASTYDGLALSAHENVVVVAIQYRLGIWGFFSTGDEHSRGNWGHLDQVAALHWVQDNIANFGGNPGSVTIFGESAGGYSVSALVLSPLAKNLFHRAISESGVALTAALLTKDVKPIAELVATLSGCKTTTSAVMVHCLRQKTEEELMETSQKM
ncbi:hypothetical protein STEG23_000021, partial [Scotinomys teguina]